jgi:hypothetical protein
MAGAFFAFAIEANADEGAANAAAEVCALRLVVCKNTTAQSK